jgi:hypothetical protein
LSLYQHVTTYRACLFSMPSPILHSSHSSICGMAGSPLHQGYGMVLALLHHI